MRMHSGACNGELGQSIERMVHLKKKRRATLYCVAHLTSLQASFSQGLRLLQTLLKLRRRSHAAVFEPE